MFGIVMVWAFRRCRVELETGVVQLLKSDTARIKAHHCVAAHQMEEAAAVLFGGTVLSVIRERLQDVGLLFGREFSKGLAVQCPSMCVQPGEARAELVLHRGLMRHHEVDELGDTGFARAWAAIRGDDDAGEAFERRVFRGHEELGRITGGTDGGDGGLIVVLADEAPAVKTGEAACRRGKRENFQDFTTFQTLACHPPRIYRMKGGYASRFEAALVQCGVEGQDYLVVQNTAPFGHGSARVGPILC